MTKVLSNPASSTIIDADYRHLFMASASNMFALNQHWRLGHNFAEGEVRSNSAPNYFIAKELAGKLDADFGSGYASKCQIDVVVTDTDFKSPAVWTSFPVAQIAGADFSDTIDLTDAKFDRMPFVKGFRLEIIVRLISDLPVHSAPIWSKSQKIWSQVFKVVTASDIGSLFCFKFVPGPQNADVWVHWINAKAASSQPMAAVLEIHANELHETAIDKRAKHPAFGPEYAMRLLPEVVEGCLANCDVKSGSDPTDGSLHAILEAGIAKNMQAFNFKSAAANYQAALQSNDVATLNRIRCDINQSVADMLKIGSIIKKHG